MPEEHDNPAGHTQILTALAVIQEQLRGLPCIERGARYEKLSTRVTSLESDASFAKGAAKATHMIVGIVIAIVFSVGGLALQVVRMMIGR